jgi:hypothetical protein
MSNPFKRPKVPDVPKAPKPPKRKDPAVREAKRRALVIAQSKRGILATILSTGFDLTVGGPRLLGRAEPAEEKKKRKRRTAFGPGGFFGSGGGEGRGQRDAGGFGGFGGVGDVTGP